MTSRMIKVLVFMALYVYRKGSADVNLWTSYTWTVEIATCADVYEFWEGRHGEVEFTLLCISSIFFRFFGFSE